LGTNVFENGMAVSCKAADGKTICAMPDVCLSPPSPPAGPVPLPYPNTGMASDTADGTKQVQIAGKEAMHKSSFFSKSTGDEAATQAFGGSVLTHTIQGKVYFAAFSMDVKFEGDNVVRALDLTTGNHAAQQPPGTPPMPHTDGVSPTPPGEDDDKCKLRPYKDGCPGNKTPHHCVPDHCFKEAGATGKYYPGAVPHAEGLCVCVEGATKSTAAAGGTIKAADFPSPAKLAAALAEHGRIHQKFDKLEKGLGKAGTPKNTASLGQLEDASAKSVSEVTGCDEKDLKKQMRDYHQGKGLGPDTKLRADPFGKQPNPPFELMGTNTETVGGLL
jgi:hypothetical protein